MTCGSKDGCFLTRSQRVVCDGTEMSASRFEQVCCCAQRAASCSSQRDVTFVRQSGCCSMTDRPDFLPTRLSSRLKSGRVEAKRICILQSWLGAWPVMNTIATGQDGWRVRVPLPCGRRLQPPCVQPSVLTQRGVHLCADRGQGRRQEVEVLRVCRDARWSPGERQAPHWRLAIQSWPPHLASMAQRLSLPGCAACS